MTRIQAAGTPAAETPAPPGSVPPSGPSVSVYAAEYAQLTGAPLARAEIGRHLLDHRPGAIPLRPLRLGDVLDAAYAIVRHAPGATIGAALVVNAIAALLPLLVLAAISSAGGGDWTRNAPDATVLAILESGAALLSGLVLAILGSALLTGVLAQVVHAAAIGDLISLDEAWRRTHGSRWAVIATSVVLVAGAALLPVAAFTLFLATASASNAVSVLVAVLLVPACGFGLLWFTARVALLPVACASVEGVGVGRALVRGVRLTRRNLWRLVGMLLGVGLLTLLGYLLLHVPFLVAGEIAASAAGSVGVWVGIGLMAAASVLAGAVVTAYLACVVCVLYLDLRIRHEGYDVELRAGIEARR